MSYIAQLATEILPYVDDVPRTTDTLYRMKEGIPVWKSLNRHHRHDRRCTGQALEKLSNQGRVTREIIITSDDKQWVCFRRPARVDAHGGGDHQPRSAGSREARR